MTGSVRITCSCCGREFWITWGQGGPKEFIEENGTRSTCCGCKEGKE